MLARGFLLKKYGLYHNQVINLSRLCTTIVVVAVLLMCPMADSEAQTTPKAVEFYKTKIEELQKNISDLAGVLKSKSANAAIVEDGMLSGTGG